MKKISILFTAFALLLSMTGCVKETPAQPEKKTLTFNFSCGDETKAYQHNKYFTSTEKINVTSFLTEDGTSTKDVTDDLKITNTNGKSSGYSTKDFNWPCDFCFVWAPSNTPTIDANKRFSYNVKGGASEQQDVLVAYYEDQDYPENGSFNVTMHHALAKISFAVIVDKPRDEKGNYVNGVTDPYTNYTVKSIHIANDGQALLDEGIYQFGRGWVSTSASGETYHHSASITNGSVNSTSETLVNGSFPGGEASGQNTNGDYLMILPQTLDNLSVSVVYSAKYTDGNTYTRNIGLSNKTGNAVTFEEDKEYVFKGDRKLVIPSMYTFKEQTTDPNIIDGTPEWYGGDDNILDIYLTFTERETSVHGNNGNDMYVDAQHTLTDYEIDMIAKQLQVSKEFFLNSIQCNNGEGDGFIRYAAAVGADFDYNCRITAYEGGWTFGNWFDANSEVATWGTTEAKLYSQFNPLTLQYDLGAFKENGTGINQTNPGEYMYRNAWVNESAKKSFIIRWHVTKLNSYLTLKNVKLYKGNTQVTSTTIGVGSSDRVRAIATFSDNSTRDVTDECTWTTSNASNAIVEYGRITGVTVNTNATITATLNGKSASLTANVSSGIQLDQLNLRDEMESTNGSVAKGKTIKVIAEARYNRYPLDELVNDVTTQCRWWSDDPSIVKVSPLGVVTGVSEGHTKVWAEYSEGNAKISNFFGVNCTVKKLNSVNLKMKVSGTESTSVKYNATGQMEVTAVFNNAGETINEDVTKGCTYTVADESILTIDANGKVTPHAVGTTTVTASYTFDGVTKSSAQLQINVTGKQLSYLSVEPSWQKIYLGLSGNVTVTGHYQDTSNWQSTEEDVTSNCTFTYSKPNVVSVDKNGKITTKAYDEVVVTASLGGQTTNFTIHVSRYTLGSATTNLWDGCKVVLHNQDAGSSYTYVYDNNGSLSAKSSFDASCIFEYKDGYLVSLASGKKISWSGTSIKYETNPTKKYDFNYKSNKWQITYKYIGATYYLRQYNAAVSTILGNTRGNWTIYQVYDEY